jgi:hypothetical protein
MMEPFWLRGKKYTRTCISKNERRLLYMEQQEIHDIYKIHIIQNIK